MVLTKQTTEWANKKMKLINGGEKLTLHMKEQNKFGERPLWSSG